MELERLSLGASMNLIPGGHDPQLVAGDSLQRSAAEGRHGLGTLARKKTELICPEASFVFLTGSPDPRQTGTRGGGTSRRYRQARKI